MVVELIAAFFAGTFVGVFGLIMFLLNASKSVANKKEIDADINDLANQIINDTERMEMDDQTGNLER